MMKMAIAVETQRHPKNREQYKVWYLEFNQRKELVKIGSLDRKQLIADIFENISRTGKSCWRAFPKDADSSRPIEVYDFIGMSTLENTHFGKLPTLSQFQGVLDKLQTNLELRSLAGLAS